MGPGASGALAASAQPATPDGSAPQRDPAPHDHEQGRVTDRPGHDRRYAIDPSRIMQELDWKPRHNVQDGLAETVSWYLVNQDWCRTVRQNAGYDGSRLGIKTSTHDN